MSVYNEQIPEMFGKVCSNKYVFAGMFDTDNMRNANILQMCQLH